MLQPTEERTREGLAGVSKATYAVFTKRVGVGLWPTSKTTDVKTLCEKNHSNTAKGAVVLTHILWKRLKCE